MRMMGEVRYRNSHDNQHDEEEEEEEEKEDEEEEQQEEGEGRHLVAFLSASEVADALGTELLDESRGGAREGLKHLL